MEIREVCFEDLDQLLSLYTVLPGHNTGPVSDHSVDDLWQEILSDKNHHIIVGCINNKIIASCVLIIVPNLSQAQRPYALIENVVTAPAYREKGYGSRILSHARQIARIKGCYKIMLMTGSKKESTLNFYKKAGFNCTDKTGFVQWLMKH